MKKLLLLPSIMVALLPGVPAVAASKVASATSTAALALIFIPAASGPETTAASEVAPEVPETTFETTFETTPEAFPAAAPISAAPALEALNADPEAILGDYIVDRAQMKGKVRIAREQDGSFSGRIFYVENAIDPKTGQKMTDTKNPDKSLRSTPCDRIMILWGLRYDDRKQCWTGGKVYDPTYGIRANATVAFAPDGRLKVTGTLMGISESVFWQKLP